MSDQTKFAEFMRAYQNMVFSTAVRLLGNEIEAEDISQEVFLKAFEHFESLSSSPTAGGWLKTVTRNLCLNHLTRYRARWRFFSEFFSGDDESDERPFDVPAPETSSTQAHEADQRLLIEQALQKLPAAQRVPLVLFHFENMGYDEIAAKLGISLAKVKTDIFRGRESLRKKLKLTLGSDEEWPAPGVTPSRPDRPSEPPIDRISPLRHTRTLIA
jgi:RNA polymerase sigma-70 factor (ECF subfamily)